ncbi:sulfite exporter TauE/SafE family protein [Thermithiobacillus plumbiphilus]|uniref:Probable membrane transporter protein n=1 Tax=Thermithiobacillus plumbiphilus TaxID=1729899 RepID=A0ABU9D4M4_9PROT
MSIDWTEAGLVSLIIFVATLIHGIAGFGFAQVGMGFLPLVLPPAAASIVFTPLAVISNARVLWSVRGSFTLRDWLVPVIGLAFGMPLGMYFFSQMDKRILQIAIALTLLVSVALIAFARISPKGKQWIKGLNFRPSTGSGITAGFLAGILGGAVAIPGPPMILYGAFLMATGAWKSEHMKAVFTAFFGTLMLYRFGALLFTGRVESSLMLLAAISLPALFLGAWAGIKIYNKIPQKTFQWLVLAMLTINAIVLLFKAGSEF